MECGTYEVIEDIHVLQCELWQLKIPKGKIFEITKYGFKGCVDGIEFPSRILRGSETHILKIS